MLLDTISDLHIDFYIRADGVLNDDAIKTYCNNELFAPNHKHAEILIVAGDLSHYNFQTKAVLEYLQKEYYTKVFFVTGNHDLYLVNDQYKTSQQRVKELKGMFKRNKNIHLLDGDILEYKGIRIGGTMGWYDGTYCNKVHAFCNPLALWRNTMNDATRIKGYTDFYEIYAEEKPKLERIYKECDVIVTHINPMPHARFFSPGYRLEPTSGFYAFDGEYEVEHTPAKLWVFGHAHSAIDLEVYNTRLVCNALGYPDEQSPAPKVITVEL